LIDNLQNIATLFKMMFIIRVIVSVCPVRRPNKKQSCSLRHSTCRNWQTWGACPLL